MQENIHFLWTYKNFSDILLMKVKYLVDYDLHIHTSASDGLCEPEEIFKLAKEISLKGIAVTDHDTIESLSICSRFSTEYNIDFIPGIEISSYNDGFEVHILGYFIDYRNKELLKFLADMQAQRVNRAVNIVNKLKNMGINIDFDEVRDEAGIEVKALGRPHIARVLVKKGYFKDTGEVFKYLINRGKPAYVEKPRISIETAVRIIKNSSGMPVLAHPFTDTGFIRGREFNNFLEKIIDFGIMGIEVYHTMHSKEDEKYLLNVSRTYNLAVTGGSDFHGGYNKTSSYLGAKGISEDEFLKFKYL
jgi:predicted metal-dependent phosphoesterase TrpH